MNEKLGPDLSKLSWEAMEEIYLANKQEEGLQKNSKNTSNFKWGPDSFVPTGEAYSLEHDFTHAQILNAPLEFGILPGDIVTIDDLSDYYFNLDITNGEIEFRKFDGSDFYNNSLFSSILSINGLRSNNFYDQFDYVNEFNLYSTVKNYNSFNRIIKSDVDDSFFFDPNSEISVSVGGVTTNSAPINSIPGHQLTAPNSAITFSSGNSNLISISDVDAGNNAVKITLSSANGAMTLSETTGLTFTTGDGTSDSSMVFTGTITNINTALSGITYNPTNNFFGSAALTLTTDDQGNTGGSAQIDTDIINISVKQTILSMSNLSGPNGFILNGVTASDQSGFSVGGGGDINGDGFEDIIVGAPADTNMTSPGHAYVVFGKASGFSNTIELSDLDGSDGFIINGVSNEDRAGYSVDIIGDMNGDGLADMLVSGWKADEAYVVFGDSGSWSSSFNLSSLDGSNGFTFTGTGGSDTGSYTKNVGDINGDGYSDMIVASAGSNEAYVIFGGSSFSATLAHSALDGTNGFTITNTSFDKDAQNVSGAGDIDGDGFDDIIIGSHKDNTDDGISYVIYGKSDWSSTSSFNVDTSINSSTGFTLTGANNEQAGYAVNTAGDFNGDGYADFLVGAFDGSNSGGLTYLVYGDARGNLSNLTLANLTGTDGFIITGISAADKSGSSVSSAGDFNGDGYSDIIIGAPLGQNGTDSGDQIGDAYILFGQESGYSSFNLSDLNATNGIILAGISLDDLMGTSVSLAGDINGDGFDDVVVGAYQGDPNGATSGESYVVFGFDVTGGSNYIGTSGDDSVSLTGANDAVINGAQGNDTLTYTGNFTDMTALGGAGADTIIFNNINSISSALRIDGGSGTDILQFNFSGGTLDLSSVADTVIKNIERIDINGAGNNTLTLGLTDVLEFSDSGNDIYIDGSSGDTVNLEGSGWSQDTTGISQFSNTYDSYVNSAGSPEVVYIDQDIAVNLNT